MCCCLPKNCGLTPRFYGSKMVAPPGGVHCVSSDWSGKKRCIFRGSIRYLVNRTSNGELH